MGVKMPARTARGLRALSDESGWAWIAFIMIVSSPAIIIDPRSYAPMTVQNAYSLALTVGWGIALLIAGLTIGSGLALVQPHLERIGLIWLIFALVCWWAGVTLIDFSTTRIAPSLTYFSLIWACYARFRQLGRVLRAVEYAQWRQKFHIEESRRRVIEAGQ